MNREEAKIQSACVVWLWNTYPATRRCFFAIENEGSRISVKELVKKLEALLKVLKNPFELKRLIKNLIEWAKKGNAVAGAQAKGRGLVAGVADTQFIWAGRCYFFEFKTSTGRQSQAQKEWQKVCEAQGIQYTIIRSVEQFKSEIKKILR